MKKAFKQIFQSKGFRYGSNATLLTVAFIVIVILLNALLNIPMLKKMPLEADLTKNKLFTLSDQSINIVNQLKQPITITILGQAGKENKDVKEIIDRYASKSNQITVKTVDPDTSPALVRQYDTDGYGIAAGSVIVESGKKFKVIRESDLYSGDQQTGQQSFNAEQRFTSAILYVTGEKVPNVYMIQGHEEIDLPAARLALERENYKVDNLNLLTGEIPQDADMLAIVSPGRDYTAQEIEKLDKFFDNGGKAIVTFDPGQPVLATLEAFLKEWGISVDNDLVIEEDTNRAYKYKNFLVPDIQSHEITTPIVSKKLVVFMPQVRSLKPLFTDQNGIKISSLLKTSGVSWGETSTLDQPQNDATDLKGPFDVALAATKTVGDGSKEAKIIILGSSTFLKDEYLSQSSVANEDFFMNSVNWLQEKKESISIRPKTQTPETLAITDMQQILLAITVIFLIPLVVFVIGGIVWFRRRRL